MYIHFFHTSLILSSSGALPPVVSGSWSANRCRCQGKTTNASEPVTVSAGIHTHTQFILVSNTVFRLPMIRFALPRKKQKRETINWTIRGRKLSLVSHFTILKAFQGSWSALYLKSFLSWCYEGLFSNVCFYCHPYSGITKRDFFKC